MLFILHIGKTSVVSPLYQTLVTWPCLVIRQLLSFSASQSYSSFAIGLILQPQQLAAIYTTLHLDRFNSQICPRYILPTRRAVLPLPS